MRRNCTECHASYDDAARLTYCPHDPLMSAEDLEQKDAAIKLIAKPLHFAGQPDGPEVRVESISWNGMVTLKGWSGQFAPHLFVIKQPISTQKN
jgi:hypothetical protein